MRFRMRFDFRNPTIAGTSMADRYDAALDMVEWADGLGCTSVNVAEHHGVVDGYLPSTLPMLAAMAQRSRHCRLRLGALIASLHDPLRIAEDIAVVDNLSRGRVEIIIGAGYVRDEFDMFGVPISERVKRVTEAVNTLRAAFSGEPFEFRGRTVQVTAPYQPGGPRIMLGGGSEPAARRAARIADGFLPSIPGVWTWYREEMLELGKPDPGPYPGAETFTVWLAKDPDEGWERMAPFFLYEMNAYGAWQAQDDKADHPYHPVANLDDLRASGRYRVVTPDRLVSEVRAAADPELNLHPLCGGIPPELAWESLRLLEHEVLPAVGAVRA